MHLLFKTGFFHCHVSFSEVKTMDPSCFFPQTKICNLSSRHNGRIVVPLLDKPQEKNRRLPTARNFLPRFPHRFVIRCRFGRGKRFLKTNLVELKGSVQPTGAVAYGDFFAVGDQQLLKYMRIISSAIITMLLNQKKHA